VPVSLPNTTTTNNYPAPGAGGAQVQGTDIFSSGWFTVANAAVIAEYSYGLQGQYKFSPEFYLPPGIYPVTGTLENPLNGIRFKSAVTGVPAQVFGAFFYKDDPVLQSSADFSTNISATGTVTPVSGSMQLLQTQIFTVAGSNFQFSSISQAFNSLMIVYAAQSAIASNFEGLLMQFNSDGGNNYDRLNTDGTGAPASVATAASFGVNAMTVGVIPGLVGAGTPDFGGGEILIPNYSSTTPGRKFVNGYANGLSNTANWFSRLCSGQWHSTSAITNVFITTASGNNFVVGSRFWLYGL